MSVRRNDDNSHQPGDDASASARPRIEPRSGGLDGIRFREPSRAPVSDTRMSAGKWWGLLLVALVLGAALFWLRQPLADRLWPETRAQGLREQAAHALSQGRLSVADGSGARELYEAALALDPDRNEAREGLMRVADAALQQARVAIGQRRFADARRALQLAAQLSAPRAQAEAVEALLQASEAEHAGIDELLERARKAQAAGALDAGADGALALYQRVLALQPSRTEALEGREDALSDLLQRAQQRLTRGELVEAARIVEQVRRYDPGHVGLPDAQAQLARSIELRRQRADRDLRHGRLDAALSGYRQLLGIDADDAASLAGIERIAHAHARRSERYAADFRFAQAEASLQEARALAPNSAATRDAARYLDHTRKLQIHLPTMLPAERNRRVRTLLAESERAASRGDWLTPPGDSAYDKLRAAQALAPTDAAVRRAATRALPEVRNCFDGELRRNRLRRAQACLEAWQQLAPNDDAAHGARMQLAQRWIAVGTERLGASEVAFARQALAEARALDPHAPGLDEFATRVKTASAADLR